MKEQTLREEMRQLAKMYHTHPRHMDQASKMKQHDSLRKQISAFEKLLQHAINKFSKERCHHMLKALCEVSEDIPRSKTARQDDAHRVVSLRQVREMLSQISKGHYRHGIVKEEESYVLKYFDNFFEDLKYLKELKKNFDVKIYMCLYEYYYDPSDDINDPDFDKKVTEGLLPDGGTKWDLDADDDKDDAVVVATLDPKQKLSYSVKQMYRVNSKWEKLYTDEAIEARWFDPDSFHELIQYDEFYHFEPVFRLVPDIFTKAFKSIELAKLWWTHHSRLFPDSPHLKRSSADFDVKIQKLENEISKLVIEIMREEDHLKKWKYDLRNLRARENRFNKLRSDCEHLEKRRNELDHRFSASLADRENLKLELSVLQSGSMKYRDYHGKLQVAYETCIRAKKDLNVANYEFDLAEGDLGIELLVRPDIILFIADLEEKIARAEGMITDNRLLKRKIEKKLALIKTNTENMRLIMEKILGSDDALRMRDLSLAPTQTLPRSPSPPRPRTPEREPPRDRTRKDSDDEDRWEDRNDTDVNVYPRKLRKEPSVIRDGKYDGLSKEDAFKTRSKII